MKPWKKRAVDLLVRRPAKSEVVDVVGLEQLDQQLLQFVSAGLQLRRFARLLLGELGEPVRQVIEQCPPVLGLLLLTGGPRLAFVDRRLLGVDDDVRRLRSATKLIERSNAGFHVGDTVGRPAHRTQLGRDLALNPPARRAEILELVEHRARIFTLAMSGSSYRL